MPTSSPTLQEISIIEYPWTNSDISSIEVIIGAPEAKPARIVQFIPLVVL
jgi:hypothetical protein